MAESDDFAVQTTTSDSFPILPQLVGVLEYLDLHSDPKQLPSSEIYVSRSNVPEVKNAYKSTRDKLDQCNTRLAEIAEHQRKAPRGNFDQQKEPLLEMQQQLLLDLEAIPFNKKLNVNLATIDPVLEALHVDVSPSDSIIKMAIANLQSCERLLATSIDNDPSLVQKTQVVLMTGFGHTQTFEWELSVAANSELASDEAQKKLLVLCHHFRLQLESLGVELPSSFAFLSFADKREAIDNLWSIDRKFDTDLLNYVLHKVGSDNENAQSNFTPSVSTNGLSWLFDRIIRPNPLGLADYTKIFTTDGGYQPLLADELIKISSLISQNKVKQLADKLGILIEQAAASKDSSLIVETVLLLDAVTADRSLTAKLKNQVPALSVLSEFPAKISNLSDSVKADISEKSLKVLKTLSKSLSDFYREDDDLAELFDAIDRIQIITNNPDLYQGVAGHEVVKSGIVLDGPPGVGKTFFMEMLQKETGYPLYTVSPEHGDVNDPTQMINAIKEQVKAAQEYSTKNSKPCFLFFDEGETVSPKRSEGEYQQSLITGYLLQAINDIRKSYPMIIPVLATNYLERLDEAMIRQGRFDIVVTMKKPSPSLRQHIIQQTIDDEGIELELSEAQLATLSTITEDFNPLPLVRTVREWHRVDPLLSKLHKEDFALSFDSLQKKFQHEAMQMQKLRDKLSGKVTSQVDSNPTLH